MRLRMALSWTVFLLAAYLSAARHGQPPELKHILIGFGCTASL